MCRVSCIVCVDEVESRLSTCACVCEVMGGGVIDIGKPASWHICMYPSDLAHTTWPYALLATSPWPTFLKPSSSLHASHTPLKLARPTTRTAIHPHAAIPHTPPSSPFFIVITQAPLAALLSRNKLKPSDIDAVELLGGGSRVPKLQSVLSEALGGR